MDINTSGNNDMSQGREFQDYLHKPSYLIAAGVVALVVLFGGFWFFSAQTEKSADDVWEPSYVTTPINGNDSVLGGAAARPETLTVAPNGETVSVSNQSHGDTVLVDSVAVVEPSWVVVRETGWILGATRLESSANNVVVHLLRATEPGRAYEVVIYVDDGDREFDYLRDMLVTGIVASFVTE